jgi:hypothetical protein
MELKVGIPVSRRNVALKIETLIYSGGQKSFARHAAGRDAPW